PARIAARQLHPGAPPQRTTGQLLDRHRQVDSSESVELLPQHLGLEFTLPLRTDMLPVASTASARPGYRTGRLDTLCRSAEHPYRVGATEAPAAVGRDFGDHALAGKGVPHEHDPPSQRATQWPPWATDSTSSS